MAAKNGNRHPRDGDCGVRIWGQFAGFKYEPVPTSALIVRIFHETIPQTRKNPHVPKVAGGGDWRFFT